MSTFEATRARADQELMLKGAASTATRSVRQLGFWSAVLATLSSIGYGIAVDSGGNVAITGYFQGTADFGGGFH